MELENSLKFEKTCGSVIFTRENGVKKYLLVENADSGHIGFPKGHVENGESEEQTAQREVFEETGIKIEIISDTRQEYTFKLLNNTIKNCVYFCTEYKNQKLNIQESEISRHWLVPYSEAMDILNYTQDKEILEKADKMYD